MLRAYRLTDTIDTRFVSGTFRIRLATKLDTLTVDACTVRTVAIYLTLIRVGLTLTVDTRSSIGTVQITHALRWRWKADIIDARLARVTIRVGGTLTDELALVVQATLALTTIRVNTAFRGERQAEPKLTNLVVGTIVICGTVARRKWHTGPGNTLKEPTAICVTLAAVWNHACIVLADHTREWAVRVALANQRRSAASGGAHPRGGTLSRGHTSCWNAVIKVTTLARATILVQRAFRGGLAEKAITYRTHRTIRVYGALSEVHAAIIQTRESWLAI